MPDRELVVGAVVVVGIVGLAAFGAVSFVTEESAEATAGAEQFESRTAFVSYVQASAGFSYLQAGTGGTAPGEPDVHQLETADGRRYSGTNAQEAGVGEPDVLKTDGEYVYYATDRATAGGENTSAGDGGVQILDATSPGEPTVLASIQDSGSLFLVDDVLVVLGEETVTGYDVSDPAAPERTWRHEVGNDTRPVTARLQDGTVYVVTATEIDPEDPCPIDPYAGGALTVECTDTYHPTDPIAAEVTYTTAAIAPVDGSIEDAASVVGSISRRSIYASEEAIYLSYLRKPQGATRNDTDGGIVSNLGRSAAEAAGPVRTGIVEVEIDGDLDVGAVGEVPGVPLNQFALDEHDGHLRVATTTPNRRNRLFVLDSNLSVVGRVTDIASGQRLTGVRHAEDTAYAVTFLRKDPFHVIDLSDPEDPRELGRVELPGVSRYLHPVGDDRVIGVGEQDGQVKLTLFDASDPRNPAVADETLLVASSTAVDRTHHAFLDDPQRSSVVVPTDRGGQVVSYDGGLAVQARLETDAPARRAMYLGDYHYVFGAREAVVAESGNWSNRATLSLTDS